MLKMVYIADKIPYTDYTPIIFNIELTHLGSEASIYAVNGREIKGKRAFWKKMFFIMIYIGLQYFI